jgi:diazepam-binding inhibitor (GABA receptor modulator, acyl-CoA-binding protein)
MADLDDLQSRFKAAVEASKTLPSRPDNDTMLKLYALFKQGTDGDVSGSRPGMMDVIGRAKYDAWSKVKGTATDDAKAEYADLVERLSQG